MTATMDDRHKLHHAQETPLPPNTMFCLDIPAEGHFNSMERKGDWTFYGVKPGEQPTTSAATGQPVITATEADSGAGSSRRGVGE